MFSTEALNNGSKRSGITLTATHPARRLFFYCTFIASAEVAVKLHNLYLGIFPSESEATYITLFALALLQISVFTDRKIK